MILDKNNFRYDENCVMCNLANTLFTFGEKVVSSKLVEQTVQIKSCTNCGHWQTYPTPNRPFLKKLYSQHDFSVYPESWLQGFELSGGKSKSAKGWKFDEISRIPAGKSLDVGSGDNALVDYLGSEGWESYGVDFGSFSKSVNIFNDYTDIPAGLRFDLLVLEDVIEHFSQPKIELKMYSSFLNIGAIILISVPYSESKRAKKTKLDWNTCVPLGHLNFFSLESLSLLSKYCGYELLTARIHSDEKSFANLIQFLRLILTFPIQFKNGLQLSPYRTRLKLLKQFYYLWTSDGDWIEAKFKYVGNPIL